MIEESEIITLLAGVATAALIVANHAVLGRIPHWRLLLSSFLFLLAGWILTILEGFALPAALHVLEHTTYTASSVLLFAWSFLAFAVRRQGEE